MLVSAVWMLHTKHCQSQIFEFILTNSDPYYFLNLRIATMPLNFVGIFGQTILEPACIGTAIFTLCYYPQVWSKLAASNYVSSKSAVTALSVLLGLGLTRHLNSWLSQLAMNNFCTDVFIPADEIVLITGGSRGIGAEMAKRFAKAGAKVVIMDLISPQFPLLGMSIMSLRMTWLGLENQLTWPA